MKIKALLSKKVATIALAGTIGLGAVGTATYAAAPGLADRIVGVYISWTDSNFNGYKQDQLKTIPSRVSTAFFEARDSFSNFYAQKSEENKEKITKEIDAYVKEKSTLTPEERKSVEDRINEGIEKKSQQVKEDLKKAVDAEFAK